MSRGLPLGQGLSTPDYITNRFSPKPHRGNCQTAGPLSGANGALPWIIFARDRLKFEQEFPQWQIELIKPIMPFRYLLSGGVSLRGLAPGWSFGLWRHVENALGRWSNQLAMFAQIVLRRPGHLWSNS